MGLQETDIDRIDALLAAIGGAAGADVAAYALERLLPDISQRRCDADDVLEEPFRSAAGFDLHLLDTSGHCIRVIDDPLATTALLIAARPLGQGAAA